MDASLLQRIDFFQLAINLGGKKQVIVEMLGLFLSSTAKQLEKMEHAEREQNVIVWLQSAHQMKGASQNITAKRLASLCREAEEIRSLPHDQSGAVMYHMYKELALLRAAIEAHLQN